MHRNDRCLLGGVLRARIFLRWKRIPTRELHLQSWIQQRRCERIDMV